MSPSAYLSALLMLARRELSEAQIRQRLARKAFEADDIDQAIERLKADRSLDDTRVALAIARTQANLRHRGKLRVKRQIESAGIAPAIAQRAADEVFEDIDPQALLAGALERRLRGRSQIEDDREMQRLYRYLIGQGFESDRVVALLKARRRSSS